MTPTVTRRILAHVNYPDDAMPELEWVASIKRPFIDAVLLTQNLIDAGRLIVVREEQIP